MRELLKVTLAGGGDYPVLIGNEAPDALLSVWNQRWRQAAVIGDSNTAPLFSDALAERLGRCADQVLQLELPAGEEHKTRATKERLEDELLSAGLERSACLVGVGGGVVLDIVGFVAATYLRGIAHVNIATSLLAQVDAAVGGKTGVNTDHGKNLIGAFHHPKAVLIAVDALDSLPAAEMRNGLAESVKHAVIADVELFGALEAWSSGSDGAGGTKALPEDLIGRCISVKADVVARDEREAHLRQILNFGHTAAHAMERAREYGVSHGAAVSMGMVVEAHVAETVVGFSTGETNRLVKLLDSLGLPVRPICSFEEAAPHLGRDKKTRDRRVHCALPKQIGSMDDAGGVWAREASLDILADAWRRAGG